MPAVIIRRKARSFLYKTLHSCISVLSKLPGMRCVNSFNFSACFSMILSWLGLSNFFFWRSYKKNQSHSYSTVEGPMNMPGKNDRYCCPGMVFSGNKYLLYLAHA